MSDQVAVSNISPKFGIMTDHEYDAIMPNYFPARALSTNRNSVEQKMRSKGLRFTFLPQNGFQSKLGVRFISTKTRAPFSGATSLRLQENRV